MLAAETFCDVLKLIVWLLATGGILTKYKLMRGLFKRRLVRVLVWKVVAFLNKGNMRSFCEKQLLRRKDSFFEFDAEMIDRIVAGVEKDGATIGLPLSKNLVDYLVDYSSKNPCFADRDPGKGFYLADREKVEEVLGKSVLVAQYFNVNEDPLVNKLANDPCLLTVAARYLGVQPKLMGVNMWWTFPVAASAEDKARHAHVFHYDLDDLKFVKFFFYLTDVGVGSGPHVYVKGSNRLIKYKNSFFKSKRFDDHEIYSAYGVEDVVHVLGAAGTCLIEDTITLHKGVTPVSSSRLLLQFEYSINTYPEVSCVCDESAKKLVV